MPEPSTELGDRVVILPVTRRDGEVMGQVLARAGIRCEICGDPLTLAAQIRVGVGAIIVTDVLASDPRASEVIRALNAQPSWSDVPTILSSRPDRQSAAMERLAAELTNVTILDRPTSKRTLLSAVQTALRGRVRQYQLRDQLTALERAQGDLRLADQRKNEFLAMLAHELRNPLAPIQTAGEVLARVFPPQLAGRAAVDVVKRQVAHLTRLVDDLLDVSRITQARIELQKKSIDLHLVLSQALESVEAFVSQKKHRLILSSEPEALYVDGDAARLVQCVTNLLTNAIKYTRPGGEITVRMSGEGSTAIISVSDTGIGITAELLPRVFDLFVQNPRSLDRSEGGLGIGLSVVQRLVEMHGGTVSASSPGLDEGSTFEIRLPRMVQKTAPVIEPSVGALPPTRILVVDDNDDASSSLAELLRLDGHDVRVADSGRLALSLIPSFQPQVLLLDIGLPDVNGYEVARQIRGTGSAVRMIAVTGYGQADDLERARHAGFDAHLVKPVDIDSLGRAIGGHHPNERP